MVYGRNNRFITNGFWLIQAVCDLWFLVDESFIANGFCLKQSFITNGFWLIRAFYNQWFLV
jgi:hypothetical protein